MLRVRKEQFEVFEAEAVRNFEEQLIQHLRECAAGHSEVVGAPGLRQVVRLGMERAAKYGLTNRGPVRLYVELMFMCGSDFDTDPQLPWAEELLREDESPDQMSRAERLYAGAADYFDTAVGPGGEYEKEALHTVSRLRLEDLPAPGGSFREEAVRALKATYPQKCQHMGEARLRLLVQRGIELAGRHSLPQGAGEALCAHLILAFGHGCSADPQFPWIKLALNDTAVADPHEKVKLLHNRLTTYLERALAR
jgi:hypothetical protein